MIIPEDLIKTIDRPEKRLILVIGASDTGKTTLVESLARVLSSRYSTGVVDLDMGQSHIGPPTTVGWAVIPEEFSSLESLKEEDFYFTGSVTPSGNLLPSLVGAGLMVEKALKRCEKVIIDTTGLVSEPTGRVLKQYKIELLRPDLIILLERSNELTHIIGPYRNQDLDIIRIKPSRSVRQKTPEERAEYRYRKMASYLEGSVIREFYMDDLGIFFRRERMPLDSTLKNRVVSLRDDKNEDRVIGVIEAVVPEDGRICVRMPDVEIKPSGIVLGSAVFDPQERTLRNLSLSI